MGKSQVPSSSGGNSASIIYGIQCCNFIYRSASTTFIHTLFPRQRFHYATGGWAKPTVLILIERRKKRAVVD